MTGPYDQVHVVRHQAPGPDLHLLLAAPRFQQVEIGFVVFFAEEDILTAVSPLGDVMGKPGSTTLAMRSIVAY